MICGASIAKRDGSHRLCLLPDQHLEECSPLAVVDLAAPPRRPPPPRELAIVAGVHFLLVLVVLLVCCLTGCSP